MKETCCHTGGEACAAQHVEPLKNVSLKESSDSNGYEYRFN